MSGGSQPSMKRSSKLTAKAGEEASFLRFAERGDDELARYLLHCGIDNHDIDAAGDIPNAILAHYRRPSGQYDIEAVAHDWFRWPPVVARIKELRRERGEQAKA
jgi:hypothetical protein